MFFANFQTHATVTKYFFKRLYALFPVSYLLPWFNVDIGLFSFDFYVFLKQ